MAIQTSELAEWTWGRIIRIRINRDHPLRVALPSGTTVDCPITEDVRAQYLEGNLSVGDSVLVVCMDNEPVVTDILWVR